MIEKELMNAFPDCISKTFQIYFQIATLCQQPPIQSLQRRLIHDTRNLENFLWSKVDHPLTFIQLLSYLYPTY